MPVSRRHVLFGLGGSLAGLAASPVPWKLLDDVSIWTQHRRALPIPEKGALAFRPALCTLCPAGCALRVRCYGARPVSVAPAPGHPLGSGACAIGLTLHQLAYHPLRLRAPAARHGGRLEPVSLDAAVAQIGEAVAEARRAGQLVLVLDRRPGRVVSQAWASWLATLPFGVLARPAGEGDTLAAFETAPAQPLGLDLERARTLLSFGAPVLDGWGRPARVRGARAGLRVIQVDAWRSPSAALADEWLAIEPGQEGPLAMALAAAVAAREPGAADAAARAALAGFEPSRMAARVGVEAARIEALAQTLLAGRPAVAVGGGEAGAGPLGRDAERAIALLNGVLGSVGTRGGIVPRRPLPEAPSENVRSLAEVPAGSVRLAILDAADDGRALPLPALARVLAKDALVVSLSPFDFALARAAQLVVPAPAPLETFEEALPTADAAAASYALAAPVLPRPEGATDVPALIARLAQTTGGSPPPAHEELLKRRVAAIVASGRGRFVRAGDETSAALDGAGAAFTFLAEGGSWTDAPLDSPALRLVAVPLPAPAALESWRRGEAGGTENGDAAPNAPRLVAFASRATAGATPVSPVLSKLYQETDLRASTARAALHPRTAQRLGLADGARVALENESGSVAAVLCCDALVPEGRVVLAAGPDPEAFHPGARTGAAGALPLAVVTGEGCWRGGQVRVREAS